MVPNRGTNTGPSHWPLLGAQHLSSRRSNNNQQRNQHWPLLWAPHLVSRTSNGTQQGNQHWPFVSPAPGQQEFQ
jgi:hypothetical protein